MKNKLTINSIALGNIKQRRKQYSIMTIGIILAMVFSSSIIFFCLSSYETSVEKHYNETGKQDAITYVQSADADFYDKAVKDDMITAYGMAHIVGFGYCNDNENLGTCIGWLDDKAMQIAYHSLLDGSYPAKEDEIAIEKTALLKLGYKDVEVGDTISLSFKIQNDSHYYKTIQKSYKLTGILNDKKRYIQEYNGGGYNEELVSAIVAPDTRVEIGGKEKLVAYVNINKDDLNRYDNFWKYLMKHAEHFEMCDTASSNYFRLAYGFNLISNGGYVALFMFVLVLASCIAIVNSFNTNLKERKKQIGMLRAVGTTRRQIIKIFGREAFIIALVCTPVSIAISYGLVRLIFPLLNENALFTNSIKVLPVCAVFNLAVTLCAALIPLIRASKITPVQAIRDIDTTRKMKTKKIKGKKEFDVPSLLAKRNLTFSKGGIIAVSTMLVATILLSCAGFSYTMYAKDEVYEYSSDYIIADMSDNYYSIYNWRDEYTGLSSAEKSEIEVLPYASSVYGEKSISACLEVEDYSEYHKIIDFYSDKYDLADQNGITEENFMDYYDNLKINDIYTNELSLYKFDHDFSDAKILSYDNVFFNKIENAVTDGKIDVQKLSSGQEIILIASKNINLSVILKDGRMQSYGYATDLEKEKRKDQAYPVSAECPYKVGDKIILDIISYQNEDEQFNSPDKYEKLTREITIGAIVDCDLLQDTLNLGFQELSFLTTTQGMNSFCKDLKYGSVYIDCDEEITDDIDNSFTKELTEFSDKYSGYIISNYFVNQTVQADVRMFFITLLAIIILGFAVCASIINSTLTASIREKKRTIGTLRAVGASEKELTLSYIKQLLIMFSWGTGIGFALYLIGYLIIYLVVKYITFGTFEFVFFPWITIAMIVLLFALCSLNLWSKIRKEMKNSIVENIREL